MKKKKDSKEVLKDMKNHMEGHYKKNEKNLRNVDKELNKLILNNLRGKNNGN
jgi:hemerythrin